MNNLLRSSVAFALLICPVFLAHAQTARLANLSTRATCQTGDSVLVTEFILQGTGSGTELMRAIGPSLGSVGIPDFLRNPTALLLDRRGRAVDRNDDWMDNPDKDAIIATGLAPNDPRESALLETLAPGLYTLVVQGLHQGTGVALPEVYDLGDGSLQFSALGVRGPVLTADQVMISGFILIGSKPASFLIRALGPSLADSGLTGVLPDPKLELHDSSGQLIVSNDNWRDTQEDEIIATGLAPSDDLESAMLVRLNPGAYTLVFSGVANSTGLGFLQIYSLEFPVRELNPAPIIRRSR